MGDLGLIPGIPWVGKIPWRREWLLTPLFWLGEFHGIYSPWDCKELYTTEWLSLFPLVVGLCCGATWRPWVLQLSWALAVWGHHRFWALMSQSHTLSIHTPSQYYTELYLRSQPRWSLVISWLLIPLSSNGPLRLALTSALTSGLGYVSCCPFSFSTWMSDNYLKFNMTEDGPLTATPVWFCPQRKVWTLIL